MNRSRLLGATFDCTCGRKHTVPTRQFYYSGDGYALLPQTVSEAIKDGSVLLIADRRTLNAAGENVLKSLRESQISADLFIIPDASGGSPTADDITRDFILENSPHADLYIAVGSGVVNDLVKWISFIRKKPYITVATAASMNGYASSNVAATIEGLKVLFQAEACRAVFADPQVIAEAPDQLTAAGLGDVLAKTVSSADWRLNKLLFDDYYCQFSIDLLKDLEPIYLNNPEGIKARNPEALGALFNALLYSSVAMTMTGTSSPASGGEHLISHTLDMLAVRDGIHHDLHGRQVGIGSILGAAIYERILDMEKPVFLEVPENIDNAFWGSLSAIVEKEYLAKLPRIDKATAFLGQQANWNKFRDMIRPELVPARKLKECLQKAGAAHQFSDLIFGDKALTRDLFVDVVKNANQMRQRFTILDIAVMTGVIPDEVDTLVDEWLTAE